MHRAPVVKIFCIAVIAFLCVESLQADQSPKFLNLSVVNGLSHNSVWCITRDRQGFFWFGTDDGLSRYDGYTFTVFRHRKDDTASISNNVIRAVHQDRAGLLWIGTSNGLNVLDPVTGTLHVYSANPDDPATISANDISAITEDSSGAMWIGTRKNGLNKFLPETKSFRRFLHDHGTCSHD